MRIRFSHNSSPENDPGQTSPEELPRDALDIPQLEEGVDEFRGARHEGEVYSELVRRNLEYLDSVKNFQKHRLQMERLERRASQIAQHLGIPSRQKYKEKILDFSSNKRPKKN